ncbi:MAG: phosphotransferase [Defluviitaleaceae bacterium]|nr:phosphotransferase [Defluviitaleaceae bacterium]
MKCYGYETDSQFILCIENVESAELEDTILHMAWRKEGDKFIFPFQHNVCRNQGEKDLIATNFNRLGKAMFEASLHGFDWEKPLQILAQKFNDNGIEWYIVGSVSDSVRGINVKPFDMDIVIHTRDYYKVKDICYSAFSDSVIQPFADMQGELAMKYFGRLFLAGATIDIAADEGWNLENRQPKYEKITWNGHEIYLESLQLRYKIEIARERADRIKAIEEYINRNEALLAHLINKKIFSYSASICKLDKGGSGASLYIVEDANKHYVIKNIEIDKINNKSLNKSLKREYHFYKISNNFKLSFLPEVIYTEQNEILGIIIVLKHYRAIAYPEWSLQKQLESVDIIAQIHGMSKIFIDRLKIKAEPIDIDIKNLNKSYADWLRIVNKFDNDFDKSIVDNIYKDFHQFVDFINSNRQYFCHGDYYVDNFVLDENDRLILIDWQNYHIGGKDEIAFYISIGNDWGVDIKEEEIKKHYCERLSFYTKSDISMHELETECNVSTVFVTFLHWGNYLQDSDIERIKPIFNKMASSYNSAKQDGGFYAD